MKTLTGQTAMVTGGLQRIGRAMAVALAGQGANIVIHHSGRVPVPDDLPAELERFGVKWWLIPADFQAPDQTETLMARVFDTAGSLDMLINSAAVFPPDTLQDIRWEGLTRTLQINAWTPLVLSREFANRVRSGRIVNLLDTRIIGHDLKHTSYILSKHSLAVLTKMMALVYAPGITVNAVAPGLILPPVDKDEAYLDRPAAGIPLRRHGGPEDIVAAVLYLLTAEYVTGEILYVDGGQHLMEHDSGSNHHQ
jgi:pteridine reductase